MKSVNATLIRTVIAGLIIFLLSLCVALGLCFNAKTAAYAEEGEPSVTEPAAPAEEKNYWEESPDIVRWTYGSFYKATNIIKAKPARGTVGFSVLYHDTAIINETLRNFGVNENGEVSDEVEAELKKLPVAAKGYVLRAAVKEGGENYALSTDVRFDVIKATNNWLVPPAVLGWRYGEYDPEINFINAVPAFGREKMTFFLYEQNAEGIFKFHFFSDGKPFFAFDADGGLSSEIKMDLKALNAGTYSLVATVPATENYTGLNTGAMTATNGGAIFKISKTVNVWLKSPSVVQWSWNRYNGAVNFFTAVPALPIQPAQRRVKFGIYTDVRCTPDSAVKGLSEFTTNAGTADGEQPVDTRTADLLRELDAGDYYLLAETEEYPNQISNFSALRTVVPFTVHRYANGWNKMPNVVQWSYGEYNPEVNSITAVPAYPSLNAEVKFNVFKEDGITFAFEQDNGGFTVDADIEEKLSRLDAGNYFLMASTLGNSNYMGLRTVVPFKIQQVQNHWLNTPSVIEWQYDNYDKAFNRITASPAYGSAVFSIYASDGALIDFGGDGTFSPVEENGAEFVPEKVAAKLKKLNAGEYYLYASVADGSPNYTGLNLYSDFGDIKAHSIRFTVYTAPNGWLTLPVILSWSEGNFDFEKNKIFAEAKAGNDKMHIFVLDEEDRILTSNSGGNDIDYNLISKLGVGSYKVRFEIEATNDYEELKGEITFAVYEDSVGLSGIIAATIVFAVIDVIAAGVCIAMLIMRRRRIEQGFREMLKKELNGK